MSDFSAEVAGHDLEFIDDGHLYLVDGVMVPSVTQVLGSRLGGKYDAVPRRVLEEAARRGTEVHEAIEAWCLDGTESDLPELRGFKFLKRSYGFAVLENEVPVILFDDDGRPVAAGRLDLVLEMGGEVGGADIKRTCALDKEWLAYQLNLYRIAYRQSYGVEWRFLRGVWLREERRKFVEIPIAEEMAWELVRSYKEKETAEK